MELAHAGKRRLCGHLAVLQLAREHGCPWDSRTCMGAASFYY